MIYPQQLAGWKAQCITTHFTAEKASQAQQKKEKSYQKQVMQLEKELRRNEKALAEAAAVLVLQKKFNVMLGADKDEWPPLSIATHSWFWLIDIVGISRRTLLWWLEDDEVLTDQRSVVSKHCAHALTDDEKQRIFRGRYLYHLWTLLLSRIESI